MLVRHSELSPNEKKTKQQSDLGVLSSAKHLGFRRQKKEEKKKSRESI